MARKAETSQGRRRSLEQSSIAGSYGVSRAISNTRKVTELTRQRQEKFERKRRKQRAKSFFGFCVVVAVAVVFVISQIYFDGMYVSFDDAVKTERMVRDADYEKILGLVRSYFFENPAQRVTLLLDGERLEKYVQKEMPEILELKIGKVGLFKSAVEIGLREPMAKYGNDFVDREGVVFAENYYAEPGVEIVDRNSVFVSESLLSAKMLGFVGQVVAELRDAGEDVEKVEIPEGAMRYVNIYLHDENYPFKTQIDRIAEEQVADIINMKEYMTEKGIVPQYVDVRVAGKGYWK